MAVKFYNTLSRSLEEFVPLDPAGKHIGMYCCGPTIHDFAHIGNFRTFVFTDLLRRFLEFRGYGVKHVMNITDVEDKIIKRVREAKTTLRDYTSKYEAAFLEDLKTLGCKSPSVMPRATEYIPQIVALIEKLIARGIAYQAADGSVYFSIDKYRGCGCKYGQLVNLNFDGMRVGERVASDEYEKESLADFALWKSRVPDDGEVFWDSPWGQGRPGWHIECSAMATALLGPQIDIHCGGVDNIFPHHEAEIAQSECCTGLQFVRYWLHCAHLMVEGQKMAKSLGNFFTLRDLLSKGWTGREIRYVLISVNYRLPLNFTFEGLAGARSSLSRIDEWVARLTGRAGNEPAASTLPLAAQTRFEEALDDDLNISGALGHLFDVIRESNRALDKDALSPADARALLHWWQRVDSVLAFHREEEAVPPEVLALVEQRAAARAAKDFAESDRLRAEIDARGWIVKDTKEGQKLTRKP